MATQQPLNPQTKPNLQVIPGLPSLPTEQEFGQYRAQIPSAQQDAYLRGQQNRPIRRSLGGLAIGALIASALAASDNRQILPAALVGGALGLGGGLLKNKSKSKQYNQRLDQYENLAQSNNQALDKSLTRMDLQEEALRRAYDLQNTTDLPEFNPLTYNSIKEAQDAYKVNQQALEDYYKNKVQPFRADQLKSGQESHLQTTAPSSASQMQPTTPPQEQGSQDLVPETPLISGGVQQAGPYTPPDFGAIPTGVPVEQYASIINAATQSHREPSEVNRNQAQAQFNTERAVSERDLRDVRKREMESRIVRNMRPPNTPNQNYIEYISGKERSGNLTPGVGTILLQPSLIKTPITFLDSDDGSAAEIPLDQVNDLIYGQVNGQIGWKNPHTGRFYPDGTLRKYTVGGKASGASFPSQEADY